MILGGTGGANTRTGRAYEYKRDFLALLERQPGYSITYKKDVTADLIFNGTTVAHSIRQHSLYRFLGAKGVECRDILSKLLLPDEAIFVPNRNLVSIVEMKYQSGSGSVDEKLQTCHFKKRQYAKLFAPLNIAVQYTYLLGDWFRKPEYRDVLTYIEDVGCRYYFDELPLADIGLPER